MDLKEESLQQFARKTSLHGLVHVVNKGCSGIHRCLWTFAFIGCLSLFVYHSISGIVYYFQYHHITKLEEKVVSEKTVPAFTFCNINPLRKSALTACDIEHLREIWHIPAEHIEDITSTLYEMNRESFKYLNGTKAELPFCGQFDWKKLYDRSAHRLWDMNGTPPEICATLVFSLLRIESAIKNEIAHTHMKYCKNERFESL
uniref:Uncharacterized protein n=1 Tax=Amphiprion percula TaxID=161767 RepID=A0A3P8SWF3_AMPPE